MNDNTRYWLWFAMALHPGNERIWQMISPFQDVVKAYEAVCDGEHPSLSAAEKRSIKTTHIEQCDSIIEYCENKGFEIVTFEDENYPPMLRNIYNPPAVLFCMGNLETFNKFPSVSCVGTRKPSKYSIEAAERICFELAKREFSIVSGFAVGIDSAAHIGAIKAGGKTAAVLACGLDYDYPKENAKFKGVIAKNGLVITEFFPGTRPDKSSFQIRNRIISGLSFGTFIAEADEISGALITAEHAVEQGRTIFCMPPADIFDKRYMGVVKYLRDGAVPVFSHLDILYEYYTSNSFRKLGIEIDIPEINPLDSDIPKRDSRSAGRRSKKSDKSKKEVSESSQLKPDDETQNLDAVISDMNDNQYAVYKVLENESLPVEEITARSGVDALEILMVLTELEMMGVVEMKDGRKYGIVR